MAEESGPKPGGVGVSPTDESSSVPPLGAQSTSSTGNESTSDGSKQLAAKKNIGLSLSMEPKRGFTPLGISKLSLSDAVAQRDQEFGGSASLPRMEMAEHEDMATGFYSARGPREFKLSLADNIRTQPKLHSNSARNAMDASNPHTSNLRPRRPMGASGSSEGRTRPHSRSNQPGHAYSRHTASAEMSTHSYSHGRNRGSPSKSNPRDIGGSRKTTPIPVVSVGSPRHSPRNSSSQSSTHQSGSPRSSSSPRNNTGTSNSRPQNRRPEGTLSLPTDQNIYEATNTGAQTSPNRVPSPMPSIFMNSSQEPRQGALDEYFDSTPTTPPSISRRSHGESDDVEEDEDSPPLLSRRPETRSGDFSGDEHPDTEDSASENSDTDSSVSESSNSSASDSSDSDGVEDYVPAKGTTSVAYKRSAVTKLQRSSSGNEAGSSDSSMDSDLDAELHSLSSRRRPIVRPKPTHNIQITGQAGAAKQAQRLKAPRARHPTSSPSNVAPSPLASSSSPDTPSTTQFRIPKAPRPKGKHGSLGSDDEDDFPDEGAYDAQNEGSPRSDDDTISGHAFGTYFAPNVTAPKSHPPTLSPGGLSPPSTASGLSPRQSQGKRSTQRSYPHGEVQNVRANRNRSYSGGQGNDARNNTSSYDTRKHYNDSDSGSYSPGGTKLSPGGTRSSPRISSPDDDEAQLFNNTGDDSQGRRKLGEGHGDQKLYYDDELSDGTDGRDPYDDEDIDEYEDEEEDEWFDDEEMDGDQDEYDYDEYDDEFDNLSLSPGSSAMLMMDGRHGDEMHRPIDFDTITAEELIREHNRNPDLLYMIEVSDPALVKWMCTPEVAKKMIYALCEHFEGLVLESNAPGRSYEKDVLSSFSYYLITSSPDAVLPAFIIKNHEIFDLFFLLAAESGFRAPPDWTRIVLYLLSKSTTAHLIDDYMRSAMPKSTSSALASLSIEPVSDTSKVETRGQFATKVLLSLIGNDNVARLFASLLMPENCAVPWMDIFTSCELIQLILNRFDGLLSQSPTEFSGGGGQCEASNLTELCVLIASKITNSPLAQQIQDVKFTSALVRVVCQKEPHPVASYYLTIMCALFDISYNNAEYETRDYPPIIDCLLKKEGEIAPLEYWAWQLDHPTLQTIPVSQLQDPARQPFGVYRLQLLKSVNSLLKTNYGLLHYEMFRTKLVTSVMDALFRHTTASMIHLSVADTIGNVMYFERTEWLLEWLRSYDLIEKIAHAFELAASHLIAPTSPSSPALATTSPNASPSPAHALNEGHKSKAESSTSSSTSLAAPAPRAPLDLKRRPVGYCTQPEYAPHLVSICIKLDRLASSNAPLQNYLSSLPRWDYLFRTFVDPLSKQYRELSDVASLRRTVVPTMIAY